MAVVLIIVLLLVLLFNPEIMSVVQSLRSFAWNALHNEELRFRVTVWIIVLFIMFVFAVTHTIAYKVGENRMRDMWIEHHKITEEIQHDRALTCD